MSAKRRLPWDFRTILYALIVILIAIAIVYFIFGPKAESVKVYSIEEVLINKQTLVDKEITVEGNFRWEGGKGTIVPPTGDDELNPTIHIELDLSKYENPTSIFTDEIKYQFTGKLNRVETGSSINFEVILIVSDYEVV